MDEAQLKLFVVGLIGVAIGTFITLAGKMAFHMFQGIPDRDLRSKRRNILLSMLEDDRHPERWRNLSTMSAVIGASPEETTILLIDIGARGSEKGEGKWGLIKYHPLNEIGK